MCLCLPLTFRLHYLDVRLHYVTRACSIARPLDVFITVLYIFDPFGSIPKIFAPNEKDFVRPMEHLQKEKKIFISAIFFY